MDTEMKTTIMIMIRAKMKRKFVDVLSVVEIMYVTTASLVLLAQDTFNNVRVLRKKSFISLTLKKHFFFLKPEHY
jgi:hypothetical protein